MPHFATTHRYERQTPSRVPEHLVIRYPEPTHAEIAQLAYSYWERRGRVHGWDVVDWLLAERELREQTFPY